MASASGIPLSRAYVIFSYELAGEFLTDPTGELCLASDPKEAA